MKKSLLLNVFALILGTIAAVAAAGTPIVPTAVFTALLLWVCNEIWYWAIAIPLLVTAVWSEVKRKRVADNTQNRIYRLTSFLLLAAPHALFAVLSLLDTVTEHQVSEQAGLPLTSALFGCTYAAVVLVWCCSLKRAVSPLSLEILWSELFEPEQMRSRTDEEVVTEAAASVPAVPASAASPRHPELQRVASELVWYGRAAAEVSNPGVRSRAIIGGTMAAGALLCLAMATQLYAVSALGALVAGVLAAGLGLFSYPALQQPARWKQKLTAAEYGFTVSTIYIVEGASVRTLPLDKNLNLHFIEVSGNIGSIVMDHPDLHSNVFRKLLTKSGGVETTHASDPEAPLQGFIQIADAAQVYEMIKARKAS